ncbi:MAG TPA: TolC family protein, partial [Aliidongia sp.]|nr:TolC family protein [Aliidongia sp.]
MALGLLVESCTVVGPDYRAPAATLQPFHSESAVAARPATTPPLDSWWTGFDDPVLTRIVQRTLAQN